MFIFGGIESGNNFLNECWFIELESFQWTRIKPTSLFIPQPRYGNQLFIHSNKLYVYGGCNSKHDFSEMLVLNLNSLEWSVDDSIDVKETSGTCYTGLILHNSVLYFYGGNIKEFESEKEFLNEITKSLGKKLPNGLQYLIHSKYSKIEKNAIERKEKLKPIVNPYFLKKHDLLNQMLPKKLPKKTNFKCLFIGDPKIGKTSFLYFCSCDEFPTNILPKFIQPVNKNTLILNNQYSLEMNDFESLQSFKKIAPITDIIFECFSVDSSESFDNISTQWNPLADKYSPKAIKILIGMKSDVKRDEDYLKKQILNNEFYITNKQVNSNSITKGK
jgi:hypothetical protein